MRTYKSFQALDFNDRYIKKEHEIHDMHALDMIILHMIFVFRYFYMCLYPVQHYLYQDKIYHTYMTYIKIFCSIIIMLLYYSESLFQKHTHHEIVNQ